MKNNNKTAVSKNKKFLIMSKLTKLAYIDELRRAFLFDNKKIAEEFVKITAGTYVDDKSRQPTKAICSYCYASGADTIIILANKKKEVRALKERHLDKHYYNCRLSADITRLVHTQDVKYLKDFAECKFIVPIRITNTETVSIAYATVTKSSRSNNYLYLAFTDLYEYEKWIRKIPDPGLWKPLQVDAAGLKRIGKDHGFIFNIYGGKNILKNKDLRQIEIQNDEDRYDD